MAGQYESIQEPKPGLSKKQIDLLREAVAAIDEMVTQAEQTRMQVAQLEQAMAGPMDRSRPASLAVAREFLSRLQQPVGLLEKSMESEAGAEVEEQAQT